MTTMNQIGKFQMREIVQEFEATLVRLYGLNMLDAHITRQDALNAYSETGDATKAAELCGSRRGLAPLTTA